MESNPDVGQAFEGQCKQLCLQGGGVESGLEEVDRISKLPDEIIGYVLSFLETQEAVRTTILSKRWRDLWKDNITPLSLHYSGLSVHKFANFVDHVLLNCTSVNLEGFNLYCPNSLGFSRVSDWICRAQERNIKKINLHVDMPGMELPEWALPRCILTCNTLVTLNLGSYFDIEVPDTVSCFPHLKSIHLHFVFPNHHDTLHRLLSCCPGLEELQLHGHFDSVKMLTFHISIPTLRRFIFWIQDDEPAAVNDNNIIINTPKLEYLSIFDNSFSRYILKNLYQVHTADIGYEATYPGDLLPEHINRLFELFKGIRETKLLILHTHPLDVLQSALSHTWPIFPSLMNLILHPSTFSSWTCLNVLHSAPNLEVLILDLGEICNTKHERIPLQSVPNCLSQCLKKIGIKRFIASEDELQVVKYLLNNAQVLELMVIGFPPMEQNVIEELLALPRACATCDVNIYRNFSYETELIISNNNMT